MGTTTKGLIAKEDLKLYDGVSPTFTRKTSSGGTGTYTAFDWAGIDVNVAYGGKTSAALTSAIGDAGSTTQTGFFLSPGAWTLSANLTFSGYTNIFLDFAPGAIIDGAYTLTFDSADQIKAQPNQQIFGSSVTVVFTNGGTVHADWWDVDGTADDVQIQAALDSLSSGNKTGIVSLLAKNYVIPSKVTIPGGVALVGAYDMFSAATGTILTSNVAADACVQMGDGATVSAAHKIENIRVTAGTGTDGIGIYVYYCYNTKIIHSRADGFTTGTGIKIAGGSSGEKPTIQTLVRDVYLAGSLVNLLLTGAASDDGSSCDEGYFDNVRIVMSELANATGLYLQKGYLNQINRMTIVDQSLTAGTVGIKIGDGARSVVYTARQNYWYALNIEVLTTPFVVSALATNNAVYGGNVFHGGLTPIMTDSSGGNGLVLHNFAHALNVAQFDWPNTGQTNINLLYNPEFERWENGTAVAPTSWTFSGAGASIARDSSNERKGTYSAACTRSGANTNLYQLVSNFAHLKGRQVTAACWVKASVADRALISLNDGVAANTAVYHTGSGSYELLSVSRKIDASATQVALYLQIETGDTTVYFDQAIVAEGNEVIPPQDAPLLDSKRLYNTKTWAPGEIADDGVDTEDVTVNGAAVGDPVVVGYAGIDEAGWLLEGHVTAANTVTVRLFNESGGALTPASGLLKVMVFKY